MDASFAQGIVGENLREGFTVGLGSQAHGGLVVRMVEDDLEVDLTEEAIAEFLSPGFHLSLFLRGCDLLHTVKMR